MSYRWCRWCCPSVLYRSSLMSQSQSQCPLLQTGLPHRRPPCSIRPNRNRRVRPSGWRSNRPPRLRATGLRARDSTQTPVWPKSPRLSSLDPRMSAAPVLGRGISRGIARVQLKLGLVRQALPAVSHEASANHPGNPAVIGCRAVRPEVLRPRLSAGLPLRHGRRKLPSARHRCCS